MIRRILFWSSLLGVIVLTSLAVVHFLPEPGRRITRQNFAKLHEGMSKREVVALLGPAGDYTAGQGVYEGAGDLALGVGTYIRLLSGSAVRTLAWYGPRGAIEVHFDAADQLVGRYFANSIQRPGLLDRIKAKVGL